MEFDRRSLRPFATFAAGLLVLVACQNATEPANNSGPITATASYTMGSASRLPDSVTWKAPKDTGSHHTRCVALQCYDTFQLSEPLGADSLAAQLWTLGIRTFTLYFGEEGSSTTLVLKASFHCDTLDTLLLSKYTALTTAQKASFSALGQGASSLVAYYASLLLSGDAAFVGKSLPVGMSQDSVKKDLVYLAGKQGLAVSQLLAKNLLSGLDSATVLQDVKLLIKAGVLNSTDSASIFPPYPVRVKTPIAVNGTLTAGGNAVLVSGIFAWTKGQNIKVPSIQVRTVKPGDSVNFTTPTKQFSSTDTVWNLEGNLNIQASSSASSETDTLVVTVSDDAGHSATSRTAFQVVAKDTTVPTLRDTVAPKIQRVSPSKDTSVAWGTKSVVLSWTVTDDSSLAKVTLNDSTLASVSGSSLYQVSVALKVGIDTFILSAKDGHGHVTLDTLRITRLADLVPPVLKIVSPSNDTSVSNSVGSIAVSVTATDTNGIDSVKIGGLLLLTAPYSGTVNLAVGANPIVVKAWDKAGNQATSTVTVTRAPSLGDTVAPKIQRVNPSKDTSVAWATKSVLLSWTVTDDSSLAKVTLNDSTLASVGGSSLYQKTAAALGVGTNTFVLLALDAHGNPKRDTIRVTRLADTSKPVVVRGGSTKDTVLLKSVVNYAPSWTVTDNALQSVTINSGTATGSSANVYSIPVTLSDDSLWITLVAIDSSNNMSRDSIKVRRLAPPTITPNGAALSGSQTTNASIIANLPGATISYSTNRTDWYAFSTGLPITSSQILYAKATLGGVTSEVDSAVFLYAPSLPASGPITSGETINITASGAAIEDSLSTGGGWTSYANSIQPNSSTKIYARSRLGAVVSSTVSGIYVLPPVLSPNPVAASYANAVTVKASDPGADSLQWRTDNSDWTKGSSNQFTSSGTFYARSILGGITSSTASVTVVVIHDTTLKSLTVSGTPVTISGTTLTMDSLPGLTTQVDVVATPNDPVATVQINGGTSEIVVSFANGVATASIVVTNGASTMTYTLTLKEKHSATFTDRDGQAYKAVLIGSQWWMAENLRTGSADGTYTWSQAMSLPASCDSTSCQNQIQTPHQGVCPSGWHIPAKTEWSALFVATMPAGATDSAIALKTDSGWTTTGSISKVYLPPEASCNEVNGWCITTTTSNGTDQYSSFLAPFGSVSVKNSSSGSSGTTGYEYAGFWLPMENSDTSGAFEGFNYHCGCDKTDFAVIGQAPLAPGHVPTALRCVKN